MYSDNVSFTYINDLIELLVYAIIQLSITLKKKRLFTNTRNKKQIILKSNIKLNTLILKNKFFFKVPFICYNYVEKNGLI